MVGRRTKSRIIALLTTGALGMMSVTILPLPAQAVPDLKDLTDSVIPPTSPKPRTVPTIHQVIPPSSPKPHTVPTIYQVIPSTPPKPRTVPTIRGGPKCSLSVPIAILPAPKIDTNLGENQMQTVAAYPIFLFYVPPTAATEAEFILNTTLPNGQLQQLYSLTFQPSQPGILRLAVPADGSIPGLTVGQTYFWELHLICSPNNRNRDDFASGEIQRSPLTLEQKAKLFEASLGEQRALYQGIGLEYDAVLVLDALRRLKPTDETTQKEWVTWIEQAGLGQQAKQAPPIELAR